MTPWCGRWWKGPAGVLALVLLTLGWVCVPAGVQKEKKKNEVKQHKNEINAVSIHGELTSCCICLKM